MAHTSLGDSESCLPASLHSFSTNSLHSPGSSHPGLWFHEVMKLITNSQPLYLPFPLPPTLNIDGTILLFLSQTKEVTSSLSPPSLYKHQPSNLHHRTALFSPQLLSLSAIILFTCLLTIFSIVCKLMGVSSLSLSTRSPEL